MADDTQNYKNSTNPPPTQKKTQCNLWWRNLDGNTDHVIYFKLTCLFVGRIKWELVFDTKKKKVVNAL